MLFAQSARRFLLLLLVAVAPACAAGGDDTQQPTGPGGGDGTGASSPNGGSGPGGSPTDGGVIIPDGAIVDCTGPSECTYLNDPCSIGACINAVCVKSPANEFGECDDNKFCTTGDACQAGACVGGNTMFCPSSDSCHIGLCDEQGKTCKEIAGNDGANCEDNDPCTYAGACAGGVCSKGLPIDCTIYDSQCTHGVCDPVDGCKPVPSNEGGGCDDGLYCTIADKCTSGVCGGQPNTCAAPGDVCMIGSCDEATDTCIAVPGNDGVACDDNNFCSSGETCSSGLCVGGLPTNEGVACDDDNGCTFGTTCAGGQCINATSQIIQCIDSDQCCPAGCPTDNDCLYWASGVQQNIPAASLTGWTQCWSGFYDGFEAMPGILAACDKAKLLMACRPTGAQTFTLLAMAPRIDVLFDCGQQTNCTKQSNGVGWYYSDNWSWGFAQGGQGVNRNSCDFDDGLLPGQDLRMCWHSGGGAINGGYRCGQNYPFDPTWQRVVYEAD